MIECSCMSRISKALLKDAINTEVKRIEEDNDIQQKARIPELESLYNEINDVEECTVSEIQQLRDLEKLGW